jgi:hypothetical protein
MLKKILITTLIAVAILSGCSEVTPVSTQQLVAPNH